VAALAHLPANAVSGRSVADRPLPSMLRCGASAGGAILYNPDKTLASSRL
jgi:hypothetical protein